MKFFQKHRKQLVAALALILAVLMILPAIEMIIQTAGAAEPVTQADIDKLKAASAALAEERRALNSELANLEGQINSALDRKLVVEREINTVTEQISTTTALIAQYDEKIAQEEVNLADAQAREAQHYEEFCLRVRAMEEEGTVTYWQILFDAADFADLLDRAGMINDVVEYDNAVMDALEQARLEVEEAKAVLENSRAEQVEAKAELETQKAELDGKVAEIERLVAELEAQQEVYEEKLTQLNNEKSEIDDEIADKQRIYAEQIAAAAAAAAAQSNSVTDTGTIYRWPLDGYYTLSSLFGGRIHPITGLPNNHRGIDIPAPYGTSIRAARGGVVITSGYNGSYGNYVVVSHGNNDSTLYAHMSSRSVSEGQTVSQGDVLGKVGSTGSSTGNHLHFEVRIGGNRSDPVNQFPNLTLYVRSGGQTVVLSH